MRGTFLNPKKPPLQKRGFFNVHFFKQNDKIK
ncbi:Hypothetical Protein SLY_0404 [Strawberry lethal yellows phytoplasma (CPA) str. NZSb11]|uniref:Uncharacterized protein n=1 Tax=Strawberry lethal yellows phytoplasma (CPA) str. NZSb11 TaxID=980422 RepID=R4S0J4_PHYAS|nr:Hypothetical Protein SLY_0404 [Strawberry lethal yellows phytoplasma (CPA) str. NZSb11]